MLRYVFNKLVPLTALLLVVSCGLDTKVKQFEATKEPVELSCEHPDAITDHPICEKFKSACVFHACKNTDDPNYAKYLEYQKFIEKLPESAKKNSTIFHDASLCANKGNKVNAISFITEPSAAGYLDDILGVQPKVGILKDNGQIANIAVQVTLSVHQNNTCSDAAISNSDWSMASANPVTTNAGVHQYVDLKFLKVGVYYLKAETPGLPPACSVAITITKDLTKAKSVIFVDPKPSNEALHSRDLAKQPKVGIVNEVGDILDLDNIEVSLSLHSDDKCMSANVVNWEADENPGKTVDGLYQFGGVAIKTGGSFYFRASSAGLAASCFGPIKVADRLKFTQTPSAVSVKDVVLPQQPIVGVAHQDGVVAPFANVDVKLAVYTDAQCSVAALPQDYEVQTNPVASNNSGLANFAGLKFKKEMKFYVRGESLPLLPTDCVPVDVGSNIKKVIFLQPLPSQNNIKDKNFSTQPKVGLVDENGNIIPEDGKTVQLTLHSDNACSSAAIPELDAATNPGQTTAGMYQFAGVNINVGGVFYLKVGSPGLESTCFGPLNVAEKLKLEQSSTAQVGVALVQQPQVKVVLPNGDVLPIAAVPVTYKIYTDAACTQLAPAADWSMNSVNPVNTNASGIAQYFGVTINQVGTYYSKATTSEPLSPSSCEKIEISALAHHLVFAEPYFPQNWLKDKLLAPQPSVEARDANGNLVQINIPVELSLHTASDCSSAALAKGPSNYWEVDATPNSLTNGRITFAGVQIHKVGKYYFKAKTSSPGILSACSFAIEISNSAKKIIFADPKPSDKGILDKPLDVQPKVSLLDENGDVATHDDHEVKISVALDDKCSQEIPAADYSVNAPNPAMTQQGMYQFSGLTIKKTGIFYIKASSNGLEPACFGPVEIKNADVLGCTDKLATNFNPLANKDDCSCTFKFCPVDKPSPDSAQAAYHNYKNMCPKSADFQNSCTGSCEDKKDDAQAQKNANSGYIYQCDKYKAVHDDDCQNISSLECNVLKASYEACYRRVTCSKFGLVDDVAAMLELANLSAQFGKLYFFNSPDQQFNFNDWKTDGGYTSFDSICVKLRYPGNQVGVAPELLEAYKKYCDCTECEDPGICNHPDADNYNPGAGSGHGTGSGGYVSMCSNLTTLAQACATNPSSFACHQYHTYNFYCNNVGNACLSTAAGATSPIPNCFNNPQTISCTNLCQSLDASFWYCAQPANQGSQYCHDFYAYAASCLNNGQPPANPGSYPNIGCGAFSSYQLSCPKICYQGLSVLGSCAEAKKYLATYCAVPSTDPAQQQKCAFYQHYAKFCSNTGTCDLTNVKWPYADLAAFLAGLPYANLQGTEICHAFTYLWSQCSSASGASTAVCQSFFDFIKSCATTTAGGTFFGLTCSHYNYYAKNCAGVCPPTNTNPEVCKFRACQNPDFEEYQKYLEYLEYCKKVGVTCDITQDDSLCKNKISKAERVIYIQPYPATTGVVNVAFNTPPYTAIADSAGNVITGQSFQITLDAYLDSNCSTTPADTNDWGPDSNKVPYATNPTSGVATHVNLIFYKAGTYYLKAFSGNVLPACYGPIVIGNGATPTPTPTNPPGGSCGEMHGRNNKTTTKTAQTIVSKSSVGACSGCIGSNSLSQLLAFLSFSPAETTVDTDIVTLETFDAASIPQDPKNINVKYFGDASSGNPVCSCTFTVASNVDLFFGYENIDSPNPPGWSLFNIIGHALKRVTTFELTDCKMDQTCTATKVSTDTCDLNGDIGGDYTLNRFPDGSGMEFPDINGTPANVCTYPAQNTRWTIRVDPTTLVCGWDGHNYGPCLTDYQPLGGSSCPSTGASCKCSGGSLNKPKGFLLKSDAKLLQKTYNTKILKYQD